MTPHCRPSHAHGLRSGRSTLAIFLSSQLPPRRLMLAPWLTEKGTAMLYSPRGVGKTLLGLAPAMPSPAVTTCWDGLRPRPAGSCTLTARCPQPRCNAGWQQSSLASRAKPHPTISSSECGRDRTRLARSGDARGPMLIFDDAIGDAELTFLDNISTLCRSGKRTRRRAGRPSKTGRWRIAAPDFPLFS